MLQRQVDVLADLLALCHRVQDVVSRWSLDTGRACESTRVRRRDSAREAVGEGAALLPIDPVEARVLRDEQQLLDAAAAQALRLANDRVVRPAAIVAAQRGDDAERALVVAALRRSSRRRSAAGSRACAACRRRRCRSVGFGDRGCGGRNRARTGSPFERTAADHGTIAP